MPYDPYQRIFKPDTQANQDLPDWMPMGEQEQAPDINPFMDALKKRMSGGGGMTKGGEGIGTMGKVGGGGASL